jgi:hypothetical protein
MRPPKVSAIPERKGTSYKKSVFFQNVNDVFGQADARETKSAHDPGKTAIKFEPRYNIFSDIVFPLCRLIDIIYQIELHTFVYYDMFRQLVFGHRQV